MKINKYIQKRKRNLLIFPILVGILLPFQNAIAFSSNAVAVNVSEIDKPNKKKIEKG
jgi:hypothetical protein